MAEKNLAVTRWIRRFLEQEPPRAKSLCVTVFGDALAPHGGSVWLSDLIELLAPFDIGERLVRTSVFRLTAERWLESQREGRESIYSLTASGKRRFEHAYRRVYSPPAKQWNNMWTLVLLPRTNKSGGEVTGLRRELEWEGFASVAPGVFAHPSANSDSLRDTLQTLELHEKVFVFSAQTLDGFSTRRIKELVDQCWNLDEVAATYRGVVERFEPVVKLLQEKKPIDPEQAFAVRTLLIHSFRRAVLHDPLLPAELLPTGWPGHQAYELCRDLYRLACKPAEQHLMRVLHDEKRVTPKAAPYFFERFGGLG